MKQSLFLLALVLIIAGCKEKEAFVVDGTIKNKSEKYIYLSRLDVNTPVLIDSSKVSKKGKFRFKIKAREADFYQLGVSSTDFITLLAHPGEKILLTFEGNSLFENYSVRGSVGSDQLKTLDLSLIETKRRLDSLSKVYEKASGEADFEKQGLLLQKMFVKIVQEQRKKNIEFILKNTTSLASIKALYQRINPETYVLYDPHDLQFLKIVTDSLTLHYPKSKHVQALARDFDKEMNQRYFAQLDQLAKKLPETKIDPDLKTVSGKRVKLSSLKGKYVLLTFWSVRSKECIEENLRLKEFYKMYNKKGFEIYQINIDLKEEDWTDAVKFDELPWISTREDDPLNPKNALIYNVKSLPTNYLYDKEGQIIASNIHGRSLKLKLEQLFNK